MQAQRENEPRGQVGETRHARRRGTNYTQMQCIHMCVYAVMCVCVCVCVYTLLLSELLQNNTYQQRRHVLPLSSEKAYLLLFGVGPKTLFCVATDTPFAVIRARLILQRRYG